jgi:hypothetical protein
MREHYTPTPPSRPFADIAFASAIGICLAFALVAWWSA